MGVEKPRKIVIRIEVTEVRIARGEFDEQVKKLLEKNRETIRYLAKK
ncbi:MAG: hypothetical protein PHS02_03970 [Candidatus ainarchaeum sp.]|nr:hypothetical protein [Candidatus ainarchaeum sp.]